MFSRSSDMKKLHAVVATTLIALVLGGCAVQPESRLDEYLEQSAQLAREIAEMAPQDPPGTLVEEGAEARIGDTQSAERKPFDPAWAQARARVEYGTVEGASAAAGAALAKSLETAGWTSGRVREVDGQVTDGYRKTIDGDRWYIEIVWTQPASADAQNILILTVSPGTTRGDTEVLS